MSNEKLTNNASETNVSSILSGYHAFAIPLFQRPYRWRPKQVKQLGQDLLSLVDGTNDFHFLGAIIEHGKSADAAQPRVFDVIDGQQRLTTLYLYLCGIVKILAKEKLYDDAAQLFQSHLVITSRSNLISNAKLHPCKDDREQLNQVIFELLNDGEFRDAVAPFDFIRLPQSGNPDGQITRNFKQIYSFLREELKQEGGIDRIKEINRCLLQKVRLVEIDVVDPTSGPRIFDSLNSKQEPMTIGDLVRNEIFGKAANLPTDELERIDHESWRPFYNKFTVDATNYFDAYFFPFGLIHKPSLKKSEVYTGLSEKWSNLDNPRDVIADLAEYQPDFLLLKTRITDENYGDEVIYACNQLLDSGAPTVTYPFLMQVLHSVRTEKHNAADAAKALAVVESFLVRRAASGFEPTGLHAVFKRLWQDLDGELTEQRVSREISKHKTVTWPSNSVFRDAIANRPLYGASVCQYLLNEFDKSCGGDKPLDKPWIEHVLPQSPNADWIEAFGDKERASELKDILANLIPLSSDMNRKLGNRSYDIKREIYAQDSMYKSARQFSEKYTNWNETELLKRASELGDWALIRWNHERIQKS